MEDKNTRKRVNKSTIPCHLYDADNVDTYIFRLSQEDSNRIQTDYDFASSLTEKSKENVERKKLSTNTSTYDKSNHSELLEVNITNTEQKHNWQHNEIVRLIAAYDDHKDELHHPKKRKYFWTNIENDMISSGFNVSADLCNHKWKNLTRSYRTAKDNKNSTGRGTCRFQFFNVMDEILGTAPSNQSTHTLSSLSNVESQDIVNSPSTSSSSMIAVDDSFSLTLDSDNENSDTIINIKENNNEIRNIKENTETPSENVKQNFKRKRNDEKIALEKEKIELRKRKLAIEEEKIKLMKEYIALKKSGSL